MNIQEMKETLTELQEKQSEDYKEYNEAPWYEASELIDILHERSQLIREYIEEIEMMEK